MRNWILLFAFFVSFELSASKLTAYQIQILTASQESSVENFKKETKLNANSFLVEKKEINGKQWYIVKSKPFANKELAENELANGLYPKDAMIKTVEIERPQANTVNLPPISADLSKEDKEYVRMMRAISASTSSYHMLMGFYREVINSDESKKPKIECVAKALTLNDIEKQFIPLYRNFFTLNEMREINMYFGFDQSLSEMDFVKAMKGRVDKLLSPSIRQELSQKMRILTGQVVAPIEKSCGLIQ